MRTNAHIQLIRSAAVALALVIVASACSARRGTAAAASSSPGESPSPSASPLPLLSCETRELHLDGADVIVQANVDATLGSIVVVHAPGDNARSEAISDVQRIFGSVQPDLRRMNKPNKWGVPIITDPCGRPLSPSPVISASPSP